MPTDELTVKTKKNKKKYAKNYTKEDLEIISVLEKLQESLNIIYNNYDYVEDPALIDCCIYEISALHMKYTYYIKLCKERGLMVNGL